MLDIVINLYDDKSRNKQWNICYDLTEFIHYSGERFTVFCEQLSKLCRYAYGTIHEEICKKSLQAGQQGGSIHDQRKQIKSYT